MTTLTKYRALFRIAAVQAVSERGELYGTLVFFPVILGVFTALWRAVSEAGMPLAADPQTLVWYLAATEWILLSAPKTHVQIQDDIRRGDVAYQMLRPVSYLGARVAQSLGALAVRAPVLGCAAFVAAFAFTGRVPEARVFVYVVPFGLCAAALVSVLYIGIGLLAFWLTDVSPIFWVWQKLLFILGGLMLPLELYPTWVQRVGALTPFPSLLSGPAGFIIGSSHSQAGALALSLSGWAAVVALAFGALFRRATRSLQLGGG